MMNTRNVTALAALRLALDALYRAYASGKCERMLVIGINKRDPLDSLLILDYPDGEEEDFARQITDYVRTKMGN